MKDSVNKLFKQSCITQQLSNHNRSSDCVADKLNESKDMRCFAEIKVTQLLNRHDFHLRPSHPAKTHL